VLDVCGQEMVWTARSDGEGHMRVPLPAGDLLGIRIQAGSRKSDVQPLRSGKAEFVVR
jgi:hypothetical protein